MRVSISIVLVILFNSMIGQQLHDRSWAYIQKTIDVCKGDKEQAAICLGVSLATLYRKLSEAEA